MAGYSIAMVSDWYYPKVGGIEYSMKALSDALVRRGHTVDIITREYGDSGNFIPKSSACVIRIKGKPLIGPFLSLDAYRELYSTIKEGGYDLVHAHGLDSPMGMFSIIAAGRLGIPGVVTNHSLIGGSLLRPFLLLAGRILLRNADAVIAVSSPVAEESKLMGVKRVVVIPNGVDSESEEKNEIKLNIEGRKVIVTVARMTSKKRVADMVEIAPNLLKKHRNLLFLMVGDGPLKDKLENKVKKMKLSENFYFTGNVPRGTVLKLLENSDIFVLPSEDEAFGVAVLEALSKGLPVVARNHSGVSDIIEHRKTGLLAENKYEIASYIEELLEKPELSEYLSCQALKHIEKYCWDDIARRVEEVYSGVINEKNFNYC